jgi:adenosylhomocysteine nucleosidase
LVAQEAASKLVLNPEYVRGVGGFTKNLPKVHRGVIASGDTFVCDTKERDDLTSAIPNLKCVEMEGAAVAQVCVEHNVPFVVARIISDEASHEAAIDFGAFVQSAAAVGSELFVRGIISHLVAP